MVNHTDIVDLKYCGNEGEIPESRKTCDFDEICQGISKLIHFKRDEAEGRAKFREFCWKNKNQQKTMIPTTSKTYI
jgi:hypothetical protein